MPPFKQQPEKSDADKLKRMQEIIEENKKLAIERESEQQVGSIPTLPILPEDIQRLQKRKVVRGNKSKPIPRIVGKSAAAGNRDDAPVLIYNPITKEHEIVPEE